jgi:hypothetical protein
LTNYNTFSPVPSPTSTLLRCGHGKGIEGQGGFARRPFCGAKWYELR